MSWSSIEAGGWERNLGKSQITNGQHSEGFKGHLSTCEAILSKLMGYFLYSIKIIGHQGETGC